MTVVEQVAEVLDAAADHIEEYGHHKGEQYAAARYESAACAWGALWAAAHRCSIPRPGVVWEAADRLAEVAGCSPDDLPVWNDAPSTSEQVILDALRAAAKAARVEAEGVAM